MRVDIRVAENERSDLTREIEAADLFSRLETFFAGRLVSLELIPDGAETVELSLSLLSEAEMRDVSMEYREIDSATDVLSFPLWEEDGVFAPPTDWQTLPLGDIVICPEVVARGASEAGRSFIEEFTLVFCHGVLHLCGFDHDCEEKEKVMWNMQDAMLRSFFEGAADA